MAHTCPECGDSCYCGGDIDDVLMDGGPEEQNCSHPGCPSDDDTYDPDWNDASNEGTEG